MITMRLYVINISYMIYDNTMINQDVMMMKEERSWSGQTWVCRVLGDLSTRGNDSGQMMNTLIWSYIPPTLIISIVIRMITVVNNIHLCDDPHHILAHLLHAVLAGEPRARPRQRLPQLLRPEHHQCEKIIAMRFANDDD